LTSNQCRHAHPDNILSPSPPLVQESPTGRTARLSSYLPAAAPPASLPPRVLQWPQHGATPTTNATALPWPAPLTQQAPAPTMIGKLLQPAVRVQTPSRVSLKVGAESGLGPNAVDTCNLTRLERVERYKAKRSVRQYSKKIRYTVRATTPSAQVVPHSLSRMQLKGYRVEEAGRPDDAERHMHSTYAPAATPARDVEGIRISTESRQCTRLSPRGSSSTLPPEAAALYLSVRPLLREARSPAASFRLCRNASPFSLSVKQGERRRV
jgi:hypothetical protein